MGYQDRDYYREGSQPAYITSVVIKLIIINAGVFLADLFFGGIDANGRQAHRVTNFLALYPDTIVQPLYWWRFLTAGFVHAPAEGAGGIGHIFFNMLGLYCFGPRLEEKYGSREFLRFYLIAIVLGFVVWSAEHYLFARSLLPTQPELARQVLATPCLGASGGVTAAVVLFCVLYPRATLLASFLFPVPAWLMGILIVAGNLFGTVHSSPLLGGVAYDVHLVGAAFALAYWHFGWSFSSLPGLDDLKRSLRAPQKWLKPRPSLKVHDAEQYYEDLDAEADRLLEKVKREGMKSLTGEERQLLEDYSRRTRQKLR